MKRMTLRTLMVLFAVIAATGAARADIYMAGDSTMCNYPSRAYPQQGWGQALALYMKDPRILHNWAIGGRSVRSFKNEGRWEKIVAALKPGDYVIIAFGHNDANKSKKERYSTPDDYKKLMRSFVEDVRAKGATPVFATSIPHSGGFAERDGVMTVRGSAAGIGAYVEKTRELGKEMGVDVLDLNRYAVENLPKLGIVGAKKLYMLIDKGEYDRFPDGKRDGCHTRDTGAFWYATAAVRLAREQKLGIASLFKEEKDVSFTPIPKSGPGASTAPLKDDFSAEEIPYANEKATKHATGGARKFYSYTYDEPMEIGNYDVTVSLGTGKGACATYVKFMGRRLAVDRTETRAGETKSVTFTARVPGPYPTRRGDTNSNRRLRIEMFCDAPQVDVPEFKPIIVPSPDSRTIYLCGDSTVTDQKSEPWGSWGQILPAFAKKDWAVSNFARSGLALKTFEGEGRLRRIFEHLKKDDWVVIQFGHNDQKIKGEEPENGYSARLEKWIDRIRERGAHPVLVTPVERRRFDERTGEHQGKTLEGYANAMKAVAAKKNVPLIDLNDASYRMHGKMGAKGSAKLQCNNKGKIDNTHHNVYGAYEMARIVAAGLAKIPVVGDAIREPYRTFDPEKPDADPKIPPSGRTDYTKPAGS